jgi:hypothetical protein
MNPTLENLSPVPLFGLDDEMEFRRMFAVQFLAAYCATHFHEFCQSGRHDNLDLPPIEDAEYLSGTVWRNWCEMQPMRTGTLTKEATEVKSHQPTKKHD